MKTRILVLALVAVFALSVAPVQAAKKADMSEEKMISALYMKGVDQVASRQWNAGIKSLTDVIDTGTPSGRFFFHVMASLAEMERELTAERTRAGLQAARQLGRKGGRKRKMTNSKIESARKLLASGVPPRDVAKNLGVSVPNLYRWIQASSQA